MRERHAKGITVTFTPVYKDSFLFVRRHLDDPVLGGYWCFPGGKVHVGETLATALVRECQEETSLQPTGRAFFVDSYLLGDRVGAHFALEVASNQVTLAELDQHAWVSSLSELDKFTPKIPGIASHLHYIINHLQRFAEANVHDLGWHDLEQFDLINQRFLENKQLSN